MIPHVNESKNQYFDDVDLQYSKEKTKHVKWYHRLLLNRTLKVVIALILVGVLAPLLLYQLVFYSGVDIHSPDGFSLGSCLVARSARLDCGLGNVSAEECHHQCCYDHNNHMCFHRFPARFSYVLDRHWTDEVALKPRVATVPYKQQNSLSSIRLSMDEVSSTHLTLTFYNSDEIIAGRKIEQKQYEYQIDSPELNLLVNSTQGNIFNTMRGPIIASENIWEIAFKLTDEAMFGLGEIPIKPDTVKVLYTHRGGLSSIPLIYAKINGSYHGLLIDTVHPTEVTFREENVIVVRSITNFGFKFHLFVGPKPVDVMKDVIKLVGFKNKVEYWMLGAHICSEFPDDSEQPDIAAYIREATAQNMPFDSHCVKPIVFDNHCDPKRVAEINEGARLLKNAGKKFVSHVSPYIIYETTEIEANSTEVNLTESIISQKRNVYNCSYNIEDYADYMLQEANSTGMYKGFVEDKQVIYPIYLDYIDFTNRRDLSNSSNITILNQLWIYTTDIDGVVLENNWPLDESEKFVNETHLYLPYFSKSFETVFNHTPAWNASMVSGENYLYEHNEYANIFTKAFQKITTYPIGASSQRMNGNVFVNRQHVASSWTDLQRELNEAALGGISGHWLWSSPVCGDTENFDVETQTSLCIKWYLAATFMPMIKLHSKKFARDPLSFNGTNRDFMIRALRNRLMFAPYFYTTLQQGPLLRPMFYQFPESKNLTNLTSQFSVGEDLLIVPNLLPSQSMVHVVMPPGVWYEVWSGLKLDAEEGTAVTMATTESDFLTLIRGGSILVVQKDVKLTADTTRSQSNFALTIALECVTHINSTENNSNSTETNPKSAENNSIDEMEFRNITECCASGSLYMAHDMKIHLEADDEVLRITGEGEFAQLCAPNPFWGRYIRDINVYGLPDVFNNYDHMRYVNTVIDLCFLGSVPQLEFRFVS